MNKMGISGRIANSFLTTSITPLLALVGLLLGVFAVMITASSGRPVETFGACREPRGPRIGELPYLRVESSEGWLAE